MIAQKGVSNNPKDSDLYFKIGWKLHREASYDKAIRAYKIAMELDPNNEEYHCKTGLTYHNMGQHEKAISHYNQAVQINSESLEGNYYMGFILIQEDRMKEAIAFLRKTIKINKENNMAYYYLCLALEKETNGEEAKDIIKKRLVTTIERLEHETIFTYGEVVSKRRRYSKSTCHTEELVNILLERINRENIHCFGDSHRAVFSGIPQIKCHNIGSATAYNLNNVMSSTNAGTKIIKILEKMNSRRDVVLLVFGEIDCMEHIMKNAFRTNKDPDELINELVKKYLDYARRIRKKGYIVMIYGPAMSGHAINSYGTISERNHNLRLYNQLLINSTETEKDIYFSTICDLVMNKENVPTFRLSADGRHLDNFPKESKNLQAIIIGEFIRDIDRKKIDKEDSTEKIDRNMCDGRYIQIEAYKNKAVGETNICREGSLKEDKGLILCEWENATTWIVIDLLDHLKIDDLSFELNNRALKGENMIVQLSLTTKEGRSDLKEFKVNRKYGKTTILVNRIARGMIIKCTYNSKNKNYINLNNLTINKA